jgi:hypothetical protein
MPKQPLAMHRHDHGRALIALTDGQLKVVDQNGKTLDTYDWKAGKAYWLGVDPAGQTHADVNDIEAHRSHRRGAEERPVGRRTSSS